MSSEVKKNGYGEPDLPITDSKQEKFGLASYIEALADFIHECDTPMTIAIQGTWGTGKTSLMNLVGNQLKDKDVYLEFNTWQYSQFNMSSNLAKSFLTSINNKLAEATTIKQTNKDKDGNPIIKDSDLSEDVKKSRDSVRKALFSSFGCLATWLTTAATDGAAGSTFAKKVDQLFNGIRQAFYPNEGDEAVTAISNLKEMFKNHVETCLKEAKGKSRVVIFIDDLDRLPPKNAVELLEVIKLFLDCENCVFVLAVDYSVVVTGIQEKYRVTNDVDKDKGKKFFDKIIQLPFKMPVAQYEIDLFVADLFQPIIEKSCKDSDLQEIIKIIEDTIGKNPRSIKRLFNSFSLTLNVAEKKAAQYNEGTTSDNSNVLYKEQFNYFFCLHCIQLSHEEVYNYILDNIKNYNIFTTDNIDNNVEKIKNNMINSTVSEVYTKKINSVLETFNTHIGGFVKKLEDQYKNSKSDPTIKDEKTKYVQHELTKLTYLTSLTATSPNSEDSTISGDNGFLFNNKKYEKRGNNNNNLSWLGRNLIQEIINKKYNKIEDVKEFAEEFKKFKEKNNHVNYQNDIIYIGKVENGVKTHEEPIEVGTNKVMVHKSWGRTEILDLIAFVNEKWKEGGVLDVKDWG